jgi:hypothetical protein
LGKELAAFLEHWRSSGERTEGDEEANLKNVSIQMYFCGSGKLLFLNCKAEKSEVCLKKDHYNKYKTFKKNSRR